MTDHEAEVPAEIKDSPHFAQLRSKADRLEGQLAAAQGVIGGLREVLVGNAVELAGFKPNPETGKFDGVAGLLVKEFTASITDEALPTKDAFLALADQYGVKPEGAAPPPAAEPTIAEQIAAMQQPGAALQQVGQAPAPVDPNDLDAQIRAAQAAGDTRLSLSLQMKKLNPPTAA